MKLELILTSVILLAGILALSLLYGNSVHASSNAGLSSTEAGDSSSFNSTTTNSNSNCVTFDSEVRVISITYSATDLTHVNDQLKDPDVLTRDNSLDKGWILNANSRKRNTLHQF